MGRKAKLKKLRRAAEKYTKHLPDYELKAPDKVKALNTKGTQVLGECTRGAYKALKRGKVRRID